MTNAEIIAMLYQIANVISGFDGTIKGLLLINNCIMSLKDKGG